MGFLSSHPNLNGTIWTDYDLTEARKVWREIDENYRPGWLAAPRGVLATPFASETLPATCLLIDIAAALSFVSKNITQKSVPIFRRKLVSLLELTDHDAFNELLTEVFAAARLAGIANPISFEPFVPAIFESSRLLPRWLRGRITGRPPASADFGIMLPDGGVTVEVTVLHVEALSKWERGIKTIRETWTARLSQQDDVFRDIDLELPFNVDSALINKLCERAVTVRVINKERGTLQCVAGNQKAVVRWRRMPIFDATTFDLRSVPTDVNSWIEASPGARAKNGIGIRTKATGDSSALEEAIFRSLTNTLKRKRRQHAGKGGRYVLIVSIAHGHLDPEVIHNLFRRRIWSNPLYRWITSFGEFRVRRGYLKNDPGSALHSLKFQLNPSGIPEAGPHLERLLGGKEIFHIDRGRITVTSRSGTTVVHVSPSATISGRWWRFWSGLSRTIMAAGRSLLNK